MERMDMQSRNQYLKVLRERYLKALQMPGVIASLPTVKSLWRDAKVAAGKKSLAYSITFQSPAHTLTDEEVNKVQQQILDKLSGELGATLRS